MRLSRNVSKYLLSGVALALSLFAIPHQASAAAVGFVGTGGWGTAPGGSVLNFSCVTCITSLNGAWNIVLADGLAVSGLFNETFVTVGGATTSAVERITNVSAVNTGGVLVSDNIYFFSDVFSPSILGTAGVGIMGYYGHAGIGGLPVGGNYGASSQAQMNFLFAPIIAPVAAPGFSLTTVSTFA